MVKKLLTYGTPKRLFVSGSPKKLTAGEAGCACCAKDCGYCTPGTMPYQIEVVFSGMANQLCSNCALYNDVPYIITQTPENGCRWNSILSSPPCAFLDVIELMIFSDQLQMMLCDAPWPAFSNYILWNTYPVVHCPPWENFDIPFKYDNSVSCVQPGGPYPACKITSL